MPLYDLRWASPSLRVIFRDADGNNLPNQAGGKYYVYSSTRNKEPIVDTWTAAVYSFTIAAESKVDSVLLSIFLYDAGTIEIDNVGLFNDTVRSRTVPNEHTSEFRQVDGDASRFGLPQATVPKIDTAVKIDGKPDDPVWQHGKQNLLVNAISGGRAPQATEFQIAHDTENLYLFVRAVERGQESHHHGPSGHDAPEIHRCDSIEIFLQPPTSGDAYYQIAVNPAGGIYDRKWIGPGNETAWDADGVIVGGYHHFDYWNVEVKIPLSDLGIRFPTPGSLWRANVCRTEVPGQRNWNAWSSTGGEFHRPKRFGILKFAEDDLAGENTHTLRGTLIDGDAQPLKDVPVKAFGRIERTDAHGVYVFDDVPGGKHVISILSPKHTEMHGQVSITNQLENVAPVTVQRRDPFQPDFTGPLGRDAVGWIHGSITEPPNMREQPGRADLVQSILLHAAKGETKAVAVSLFANQMLDHPDLQLTRLSGRKGVIDGDRISIGWVQRMLKPVHYQGPQDDALFVWRFVWNEPPKVFHRGQLRLITVKIDIPEDTQSGEYSGDLVLKSKDQLVSTIPINLSVGDFKLDQPAERAGAFLNIKRGSLDDADPRWAEIVFADMAAHGARTVMFWQGIVFDSSGQPITEAAEHSLRMQMKHSMSPPYAIKFSVEQLARTIGVEFKEPHAIDIPSLQAKEMLFRDAVSRGAAAVRDLEKKFALKPKSLVLFWSDEVFIGERLDPWMYTANIVREYTDNPIGLTFDPRQEDKWRLVEPLVEAPFFHGRNLDTWIDNDERTYQTLRERLESKGGVGLAYYNITRTDVTPEYARICNGLWLWQTPLNAQMHWTYFWGDQDALVGVREGERLAPYFALAAPHPTKMEMVSTLDWENLREGVTDHQYITTLENAIESAGPEQAAAVEKAKALLAEMWAVDPRVTETAKAIDAAEWDRRRSALFESISELKRSTIASDGNSR
ncbi:carbohydrate-binding family 9-like protein [Novipirellula artificiosorum]|uniref:Carbohydrate-binding domain-containing protein n=1 Tax=Novipirellula artificiosorum TaxID=2528016 RepID=A0A5C6DEP7_9BACT|nr:carbohydrate-binding family 9-like protein [Novipirellula artificiosorum]TWU34297.1 hypothetical protein Poly41_44440 [Novipirellula artificiosorum]